jgi:hypothetical protein
MWAPTTNHLYIEPSSNYYNSQNGIYYGLVVGITLQNLKGKFDIHFTTSNAYTTLPVGIYYSDYIEQTEIRYFRYPVEN